MAVTGTLDAEARRSNMVTRLEKDGRLLLADSATLWNVHPMTIRRDFEIIESAGLARRVRGGIVSIGTDDFSQRQHRNATAKQRISEKLLDFVTDGMTVGLDASTTIHRLASSLRQFDRLSVITNGLTAFEALHEAAGVRSFLTGGEREEKNISLVGPLAVRAFQNFNLDVCFISTMSVDPRLGTSETTIEQVAVKEAMVEASSRVILAVDASKLDTRAQVRSLGLDRIDVLVTELNPDDKQLDAYRDRVAIVI